MSVTRAISLRDVIGLPANDCEASARQPANPAQSLQSISLAPRETVRVTTGFHRVHVARLEGFGALRPGESSISVAPDLWSQNRAT
jgi:hypothetical protein